MDRPEQRAKHRNWVKGALSNIYLKDGMKGFADDVVQQEHKRILRTVIDESKLSCNKCCLSDLKPSHTCTVDPDTSYLKCPLRLNRCNCLSKQAQSCPNRICDAIMEEILKTHRSKPPRPIWRNTDVQKWCTHPWEIAKCFITSPRQADELDGSTLLQLFINNVSYMGHFSEKLIRSNTFKKIVQRINEIFHSPTMEMENSELEECLDEIIIVLEDEKEIKARKDAQQAVSKIKQLKQESYSITSDNEYDVLEAASKHLLEKEFAIDAIGREADKSYREIKPMTEMTEEQNRKEMHTKPTNHKDKLDIMRQNYQVRVQCVEEKQDKLWLAFFARDIETDLLAEGILPRSKNLQIACRKFGRHSKIVCNICSKISEFIKMSTNDIVATWAERETNDEMHLVFVAITRHKRAQIVVKDYIINQREINSSVSQDVLAKFRKAPEYDRQAEKMIKLKKCIATHSDLLMDLHSHLNIISPSLMRSRGYGASSHVISNELCIALYVDVKGFLPLQETPFPKQIDGFPTDVREGRFESFTGRANDIHKYMKMGLAIHADNTNGGTLGGFVEHPLHGLCGITSAHVLLSGEEMIKVAQNGGQLDIQKQVYHPIDPNTSTPFGKVVSAVIKEESSTAGVEVAMFKLEDKFPLKGDFPEAFNYSESGFDNEKPLLFNSGMVLDVTSRLTGRPEVYKFGITTGITRGSFGLQGSVIRKKVFEGQWGSFEYRLKNLIEILAIGEKPFALRGDSGALVMIEEAGGDSVAIGMVQGGLSNGISVFVSPICNILESLGCPLTMKKFHPNATCSQIIYQRTTRNESMEIE